MYVIKLKTAEKNFLKLYLKSLLTNNKYNLFSLKKTKHFESVIRSPHANKNSQEQFHLVYFKHIIKLSTNNKIQFYEIKQSLFQDYHISGSIQETKTISFNSFF